MQLKFQSRKIQQSKYTRWIALPPAWLESIGVTKGDKLMFELAEDGNLIVKPV